VGGSSTQPLYDDGTHGDVTAADGTYSFTVSTSSSLATGAYPVTPTVTSGTSVTATTATLTVTTSVVATAIHTIQAAPATYLGTVVNVSGVVTGVTGTGFYLEAKTSDQNSPLTSASEAIYVNTGSPVPASAVVGNNLQLLGTVAYSVPVATSYLAQALQLNSPTGINILATGLTLPTAITLTTTNLSATGSFTQLLQYQSMRVTAPSLTTTSGTGGTLAETTETYTSNGQFYGVLNGVTRPFRAAGADSRDAAPTAGAPSSWTRWSAPPNLLLVDSAALGGTPILDVVTGTTLAPTTGVLDYTTGQPALLISSVTAERPVVTLGSPGTTATAATATQLSVATLNMQRFYDTETVTGAVTIGTAGYNLRLAKASYAIRNALGTPDVIALQEVESAAELATLSSQISTDATAASQPDPTYVVTMGVVGPNGYGEAFLTKPSKVTVSGSGNLAQGGCGSYCYTDPTTGTNKAIWDYNPLYINAKAARGSIPSNAYGVYIINAELLPTTGISSNTVSGLSTVGAGVRAKRLAQAQQLAGSVIALGTSQPIIVAGNLNAYEFSDGYVDVLGILTNAQAAQNTVVAYNTITYATTLTNLVPSLAAANRYTVNENGVADTLDHILVTSNAPSGTTLQAVHIDSDYNVTARATAGTPNRTSDHDALVATVQVPQLAAALTFNPPLTSAVTFSSQAVGTSSASKPVVVTNTSTTTAITITSIVASAGFSQTNNCGSSIAALGTCTINITFSPTVAGSPTGTVILTDNDITGTQTISLSGTSYNLATTTTTVTSLPVAPVFGQSVVLTATIPGNGTVVPSGTVIFKDGTTVLTSTAALTAGSTSSSASYTASGLTAATHPITAIYSGDSTFATSTGTLSLVVSPVSTTTSVVISPASAGTGTAVIFTASVTSNLGTPGGTIQFYDGSATIGAALTLVSGSASYTTSSLALGTHNITAVYSGATGTVIYPASTSAVASITILQSDFSMTLSNTQLIVGGGIKSATTAIAIVATNGFNSPITFSCSGLPASSSCIFSPATVTPAGFASSSLTITTNAAANHVPAFGFRGHGETLAFAFTLLLAPLAFRKRKSALRLLALVVLLIAGLQTLTGCGSGTTPSGTNTVTVTGTSASGVIHTATISLVTQ
jgi:endonuclease/exonuclease/phosphatase family metal-dependent hydrolase